MKKILIVFILFHSVFFNSQDFIFDKEGHDFDKYASVKKNYKIFQFLENDSINGKITKTVYFNHLGNKIFESTNDYKYSLLTGIQDHITSYFYKKNLLTKTKTTLPASSDKLYSSFRYNHSNQLVCIILKSYEKTIKDRYDKSGELIDEDISEAQSKWKLDFKKYFEYGKNGDLIKTYIPPKFNISQNIFIYDYLDDKPVKISSYTNNQLIWDEFRQYLNKNDYDYLRIWSRDPIDISEICKNTGKVKFTFNKENRIIELSQPDYTGIRGNTKTNFFYNTDGNVIKVEIYSVENKIELTSYYIYD